MNKFLLSGRLTADPEISNTQTGTAVARFNFAVNRRFKKEGEPDADFFSCAAFGKTAELFQKCDIRKGTKLLLEAEVRNNNYEKDGVKHYGTQLFVNSIEFCESKAATGSTFTPQDSNGFTNNSAPSTTNAPDGFVPIDDSDIPF